MFSSFLLSYYILPPSLLIRVFRYHKMDKDNPPSDPPDYNSSELEVDRDLSSTRQACQAKQLERRGRMEKLKKKFSNSAYSRHKSPWAWLKEGAPIYFWPLGQPPPRHCLEFILISHLLSDPTKGPPSTATPGTTCHKSVGERWRPHLSLAIWLVACPT